VHLVVYCPVDLLEILYLVEFPYLMEIPYLVEIPCLVVVCLGQKNAFLQIGNKFLDL
jgi:hypothetical protein